MAGRIQICTHLWLVFFASITCTVTAHCFQFPKTLKFPRSIKRTLPSDSTDNDNKKKIGLVLGGGGARGLAHLGILEILEQEGIHIDFIAGCSVGGIIGGLYAANPDVQQLKKILLPLGTNDLVSIDNFEFRTGISRGDRLESFLKKHLKAQYFHETQIPFETTAFDLKQGKNVELNEGLLIPAIHGSAAFPLIFQPVDHNEMSLIDGGVQNPVPTSLAKKNGIDLIIAVDLGSANIEQQHDGQYDSLVQIMTKALAATHSIVCAKASENAHILIRPEIENAGLFDDGKNHYLYEAGRSAALKHLPNIYRHIEALESEVEVKKS